MIPRTVIIRGAGDLATGVAHRLINSGFAVIMLELARPLVVRRTVSFAAAVYEGEIEVENISAELCPSPENVEEYLQRKVVPVLIDPLGESLNILQPSIIIDAIMSKKNSLTGINDAELVIGLGPGFTAGKDVHAVIETERGHNLGRVIYQGSAAADTSEPANLAGYGKERLLRATVGGFFKPLKNIGEMVTAGEPVAVIGQAEITANIDGMIRGMLYPDLEVKAGMKVGDIDPRGTAVNYHLISDKARAIGGGVLEVILNRYSNCTNRQHDKSN